MVKGQIQVVAGVLVRSLPGDSNSSSLVARLVFDF